MHSLDKYNLKGDEVLRTDGNTRLFAALHPSGSPVTIQVHTLNTATEKGAFQNEAYFSRILASSQVALPVHDIAITPLRTGAIVCERANKDLRLMTEAYLERRFPVRQGACVFKKLCQLVDRMHSQRIAHLDLKPENILVDHCGQLRLAGFSHSHKWNGSRQYDGFLSSVRSKEYSSPERFFSDNFDVVSADVFSLGVILHWMLTGYLPYASGTSTGTLPYQLDLGHARTLLNSHCFELLSRMLHPEPTQRPSLQQVLDHRWMRLYAVSV
jgi:serine/threonine protein kinase